MHKYLEPLLICPKCRNELNWEIKKATKKYIVNADINCSNCGQNYFVKDRIANFLVDYEEKPPADNWESYEEYDSLFFKDNPDKKQALLNAPIESLNVVDLYLLDRLLQKTDNPDTQTKDKIAEISRLSNPTRPAQDAVSSQLSYVWNILRNHSGFVLDVASGQGSLANRLFASTKFDIIVSDISYFVLRDLYKNLSIAKKDRIIKMAFDAAASPFRDGSVDIITTCYGLQEIPSTKSALKECYRICNDKFYAIASFSPEDDDETYRIKKETYKLSDEVILANKKDSCMDFIREAGFNVECENSKSVFAPKAPRSEFIPGFGFDALPVFDSTVEFCTLIAKKQNGEETP